MNPLSLRVFIEAYIDCALWASAEEIGEGSLHVDTKALLTKEATEFYTTYHEIIEADAGASQAGYDFWLTRCGHGCGFWDGDWTEPTATILTGASQAAGERDLYTGDDGYIYQYQQ